MSMMITRNRKQYAIPDPGPVMAELIEINDLGMVDGEFGPKEKIQFVWRTEAHDKRHQSICVYQRFTRSIHPKARLCKAIRSITGENPGDRFDLEMLKGLQVQLIIEHNEVEGIIYANVAAIVRPPTDEERASEERVQSVIDAARAPKPLNLDAEPDLDVPHAKPEKRIPF